MIFPRKACQSPRWKLPALFLVVLLGVVLCGRLTHPWTYNDDYNGAFWSQAADNLARAGLITSAGVPAPLYFGPLPIPRDALYVHHPTLLPAMMLADRALLGESEWAARVLPIVFSILTAILLWRFTGRTRGWREAAFALAMFCAAPMELHYGQMPNFEAPELLFLLAGLVYFELWQQSRTNLAAAGVVVACVLAMSTDWQGYLLVVLLAARLLFARRRANIPMCAALLLAALFSGCTFLVQIHLADPAAWQELRTAFLQRSSHADLSGAAFTLAEWARTELTYLTTLYEPLALVLAIAGAITAFLGRRKIPANEAAPFRIANSLFLIDAFYVCALRNQSYIHDFAQFYLLIPVATYSGYLLAESISWVVQFRPRLLTAISARCILAAAMIAWAIVSLRTIDTPFDILDGSVMEPAGLMPDIGRVIDRSFPPDALIVCNFDPYYSPLPYYARREMANNLQTYPEWREIATGAAPRQAGGIVWKGAPDAATLLPQLPPAQTRDVTIDGIPFVLWQSISPPK